MTLRNAGLMLTLLGFCAACNGDATEPPVSGTGNVEGTVQAAGEGVAGATVALQGGATVATDATGAYGFAGVPAGTRQLTLTVPSGFNLAAGHTATKSTSVTAGQTANVSWQLVVATPGNDVQEITASGVSFSPQSVTITAGTTVRWVGVSGGPHTVTPDNPQQAGVWSSASLNDGDTFEFTFDTPGSYTYHCQPHQAMGMTGSIVVQ